MVLFYTINPGALLTTASPVQLPIWKAAGLPLAQQAFDIQKQIFDMLSPDKEVVQKAQEGLNDWYNLRAQMR